MFDVEYFLEALSSRALLTGALVTIALSAVVQVTALLLSLPFAAGLTSPRRWLRTCLKAYVWLFRGAPTLLILLFCWNGLPQLFPSLRSDWFSPFLAAFLAMSLVGIAYNGEIVRAGLLSVNKGQHEAIAALGISKLNGFLYVILPQAMRVSVPSLMNEFISLLKSTSLAYTISLKELMTTTTLSITASFKFTEWYVAALVYYLVMVTILTVLQSAVEKRMSRALHPSTTNDERNKQGTIPFLEKTQS
ncbi:amino acid ABC transporter permease [Burkholderia sp. SRS-46]|nr:amino acid ABC transporter permease [Burkholderia sp. SRS-46]